MIDKNEYRQHILNKSNWWIANHIIHDEQNDILSTKINAKAVANEYPEDARPLMINGNFVFDKNNHLVITNDDIHAIQPVKSITNTDVVVKQGRYWLCDVALGIKSTTLSYIGVGSGITEPTEDDTDVETIIGARHVYTSRMRTYTTITISAFFQLTENNGTWNNAGVFTAATSGDMFCHSKFVTPVEKTAENTQRVDFDITISI